MNKVIEIFEEIKVTNSKKDKINIIKNNEHNLMFKECLKFLFDNMIITGLSENKLNKNVTIPSSNQIKDFKQCMHYLKIHNTGTDKDIAEIQAFINSQPKFSQEFYSQMVTKSLKIGCDAKSANKAIPNLIPTFDLMLGTSIENCKLVGNELISLSHKLNGTRIAFINGKCFTRQGKEYIGVDHIISDIHNLGLSNYFVDGELIYKNKEDLSDSEAFQKGVGIAMSKSNDKSELKFVVFDMFPIDEFYNGKSNETYSARRNKLATMIDKKTDNVEFLEMLYQGYDHSEIWKWLDYAEENDWEGIMINLDTPYECKRTKNLIKVKKFLTCDIRCVNIEEGSGRNKGRLGALVCNYKGNLVNVGSGFSDEDRELFWKNKDEIIGRIIEVRYKEVTKDKKTELESLQFPSYLGVRENGKEESYD